MARLAGTRATSVVLMGMGEPLANYANSLEAVRRLTSPDYLGIGVRHITVSTVGIVAGMIKMAEEWPHVNLAVSLHAPDDATRRKIVPSSGRSSIAEILEAAGNYARVTGRRYMVEYALIAGVNASRSHAEDLAALLRRRPAKVNLIPLNTGGTGKFAAPLEDKIKAFRDVLAERGLEVIIRKRRGRDIEAACGQLRLRENGDQKCPPKAPN
jgi:23S rRNA (adenine2503-C2)-methyltransferase